MKRIDKLLVLYREQKVGDLSMNHNNTVCAFEYDKDWIASGFSISPLHLPLQKGVFLAKPSPFCGNFGIFEDSLPDGYGRYLLHKLLKKENINDFELSPLDRLSIIGNNGMGALSYSPQNKIAQNCLLPELEHLQQMALEVLSEKTEEGIDLLYFSSGNSGGCRPKCLWKDNDGQWIVKFRHTYDPKDMGLMEYKYNEIAHKCGIEVPEFKLLQGKYFTTKRFDIENSQRMHIATAGAILNQSINMPSLDYIELLKLTGYITQSYKQVEQMFRRMVFNILTDNKDDHAKNFSFIVRNNKWFLAPAYDLTLSTEGYRGEHATTVNNNGKPKFEDMIIAAESIRISRKSALLIIEEIRTSAEEILAKDFQR